MKILCALLLIPSLAFAAADDERPASLRDFSGGINDNSASVTIKGNEAVDALNVIIDEPWGQLKTRTGYEACGQTPSGNTATNIYEYSQESGTRELIVTDDENVWATQDCVNFSTVATGLSQIANPYFDTFRDKVWVVNKSSPVITWDGSTATLLDGTSDKPNPPIGQYITHWKERVWIARTATEPSAVYFSALTDDAGTDIDPSVSSQAWPSANAFYIAQEDGSPIYGIKVYRDNLFVFKATGIWRIIFESEFNAQIVKSVSNIGCKFQDSIIELDNFLYFVGPDGIYKFDGVDAIRISDNINTTFRKLRQLERLDKFESWDSASDFDSGTFVSVSSTEYNGSVALDRYGPTTTLIDDFSDGDYTASPTWTTQETGTTGSGEFFVNTSSHVSYTCTGTAPSGGNFEGEIVLSTGTYKIGTSSVTMYSAGTHIRSWPLQGIIINAYNDKNLRYYFVSDSTYTANATGYAIELNCRNADPRGIYCYSNLLSCNSGTCSTLSTNSVGEDTGDAGYGRVDVKCENMVITTSTSGITISGTGTETYYVGNTGTGGTKSIDSFCSHSYSGTNILSEKDWNNSILVKMTNNWGLGTGPTTCSRDGSTGNANYDYHFQYLPYLEFAYSPLSYYYPSGTYTSAVSTYTSLSAWRTFDVSETLNGQSLAYSVRTGTTAYNTSSASWQSITSGTQVSTITANNYFQWKADFSTSVSTVTPTVDTVLVNYQEGDAPDTRLTAINYNNRYYLAGSTTTAGTTNDVVLVKSKSPLDTWVKYDIPVSAWAKWNSYLYGGKATNSDIIRLDYGTNDDGSAINSYWTWGDQTWESLAYKKKLLEVYAYYVPTQSSANTIFSYSTNGGTTWTDKTINLTGTTAFNTEQLLVTGGPAHAFRAKISNNTLDQSFNLLGIDLWATVYKFRN